MTFWVLAIAAVTYLVIVITSGRSDVATVLLLPAAIFIATMAFKSRKFKG